MTARISHTLTKVLLLAACVAVGGGSMAAAQSATQPHAVAVGLDKQMADAVAKHDAALLGAMYSDNADVVFTGDGTDKTHGRQSIEEMWKRMFSQGLAGLVLKVSDANLADGVITESGTFSMTSTGGQVIHHGTYRFEWIKDGATWKIRRHEAVAEK
jgi:ketosteroid isomerase-like protein